LEQYPRLTYNTALFEEACQIMLVHHYLDCLVSFLKGREDFFYHIEEYYKVI